MWVGRGDVAEDLAGGVGRGGLDADASTYSTEGVDHGHGDRMAAACTQEVVRELVERVVVLAAYLNRLATEIGYKMYHGSPVPMANPWSCKKLRMARMSFSKS